ncbi:formate/nitrite transporter family protein [Geobacter sp. DSM 9736]|uniref:formate/nitrite transporter family protein n=1 Tax=Geobacter sp. DSM 9736 TaxID=1277350 RepID=UPI000B4FDFE9|nr:formate/nitrite transporter family protein [Geobacter sp. DSM 9736]SNB45662.1 formate/nitrite transporter [Geobacter sp. DSM 9736]
MDRRFLTPVETVRAIVENGRRVITQSRSRTLLLSILAGFYIACGAQLATVVTQDTVTVVGRGLSALLGGSVFSVGLMLVVICGAELFTGNSLLANSVLHGEITCRKLLENWLLVIIGNFAGSLVFAWLMFSSRLWANGAVAEHAIAIATAKCELPFTVAFVRGILCNWLVCLAVFMATAARDVAGKILACYVPITAFVASGFEHSVANMYFIPAGLLLAGEMGQEAHALTWYNFFVGNLLPVTIGNVVGGVVFVGFSYWYIHLDSYRSGN